jgi:hypothetical protein
VQWSSEFDYGMYIDLPWELTAIWRGVQSRVLQIPMMEYLRQQSVKALVVISSNFQRTLNQSPFVRNSSVVEALSSLIVDL